MRFTKYPRTDRPGTFRVVWKETGKRRTRNFPSNESADNFIRAQKKLAALGAQPTEVVKALRLAAGTGYSLETLVLAGLEKLRRGGDPTLTFRAAAALAYHKAKERGRSKKTLEGYEHFTAKLNKALGDKIAVAITEDEVRSFLASVKNRQGNGPAKPASLRTYLTFIRTVLSAAGIKDAFRDIATGKEGGQVRFFTPTECLSMFKHARPQERGFLAVALIAGIRPENLERLRPQQVNNADRWIRIDADQSKDGHPHLLESGKDGVLPDALWTWLEIYPFKTVNWRGLQQRLRNKLKFWIQDGLRHTAASYYFALHGKGATARLLTHSTENLVRRHYAGIAPSATAREFYALSPKDIHTVATVINMPLAG